MKYTLSILAFLLLLSCDKLSIHESAKLPIIEILEAKEIDETGVTLKGYVHHLGTEKIIRSSFNWYPKGRKHFIEHERFLMDVTLKDASEISVRINRDLIPDQVYTARLIVELEDEKIYSSNIEFTSQGAQNQPIRLDNNTTGLGLRTDLLAVWGLNQISIATSLGSTSGLRTFQYDLQQEQWKNLDGPQNGLLFRNCFLGTDERLFFAGKSAFSTAENVGLWHLDDFANNFERIGDFPRVAEQFRFSFIIDNRIYVSRHGSQFSYFELDDYSGSKEITPPPFPLDAYKYYAFTVNGKAYLFFSVPQERTEDGLYTHQLWMFDPTTLTWTEQAHYPGAGKDFFTTSTDKSRYIYIGMGAVGKGHYDIDASALDGDIWRFDVTANSWEFLGWIPTRGATLPAISPRLQAGKHHFVLGGPTRVLVYSISPEQISSY